MSYDNFKSFDRNLIALPSPLPGVSESGGDELLPKFL